MIDSNIARISTDRAPDPAGHYSQAVSYGGVIYVATQLPKSLSGDVLPTDPVEKQLKQALMNAEEILKEAGSSLTRALLVTLFVADVELWPRVNAAYAEVLGESKPARSVIPTGGPLHLGYQVAVQVIAAAG
ncbi:MAG TPA: RidA family protein [Gemmatimonadaceae bacterium]|nr:RidA family protein [Gemmatimonadaceae bacterium]